jgi:hypothetical protein
MCAGVADQLAGPPKAEVAKGEHAVLRLSLPARKYEERQR